MTASASGGYAVDECGCAMLAGALAQCAGWVFAVPGYPVTHCCSILAERHERYELSINEAVAVEAAVGLSACGVRSAVLIKQVGLNVAADALTNAIHHSIGAGLVLLVGDDIGATKSTCDQDSRTLLHALDVPVIDLASGPAVGQTVAAAFAASDRARTPVAVRFTGRLHDYRTAADCAAPPPGWHAGPVRIRREVAFDLSKKGRRQHHHANALPLVAQELGGIDELDMSAHTASAGEVGVIAAGDTWSVVRSGICQLKAGSIWPISDAILEFCRAHRGVLVLEDTKPVLENELRNACLRAGIDCLVRGRGSGHLPVLEALTEADVDRALASTLPITPGARIVPEIKHRGTADRPAFHQLFRALQELAADDVVIAADVGSACRVCYPPYEAGDIALCLGSPIAVAAGAARAGRKAVAVIGDYALFHSGFPALVDAVNRGLGVITVVLMNGVSAQTGGQSLLDRHAALGPSLATVDRLAAAVGVSVHRMPADSGALRLGEALRCLLSQGRPALVLCTADGDRVGG